MIKFQRVEKSASRSGKVMMQCSCSGRITTASMRNGCHFCTVANAARNEPICSTSNRFPLRCARFTVKNQLAPGTWARRYSVMLALPACISVTRAMRFVPHRILQRAGRIDWAQLRAFEILGELRFLAPSPGQEFPRQFRCYGISQQKNPHDLPHKQITQGIADSEACLTIHSLAPPKWMGRPFLEGQALFVRLW